MIREMGHVLYGSAMWLMLRMRFQINYQKVVLVLVNENEKLDYYALAHLEDFMQRKYAKEAVILFDDEKVYELTQRMNLPGNIRVRRYPDRKIRELYTFYSFHKFFENIVFTYAACPKDNQLGKALKETQINEEDAVCLGFYHLRTVPVLKDKI